MAEISPLVPARILRPGGGGLVRSRWSAVFPPPPPPTTVAVAALNCWSSFRRLGFGSRRCRGGRGGRLWRLGVRGRGRRGPLLSFEDRNERLNRDGLSFLHLDLRQNARNGRGAFRVHLVGGDLED